MATREEEYLRRQAALGYVPSLAGMDDEELDYVPSWSSRSRGDETVGFSKIRPGVDRDFAAWILKMFARPSDPRWQVPDLDGPEFYRRVEPGYCKEAIQALSASVAGSNTERGSWWVDPFGIYLQGGEEPGNKSLGQGNVGPESSTKQPQELWDEVWRSPDVINSRTPNEKRRAVNRIVDARRAEFEAAYSEAFGDKANSQWENDRKYTLRAMGDYVSADQLRAFGWHNVNEDVVRALNDALGKYDITTPTRIRHFLAQCAVESDKGRSPTEQDYGDKNWWAYKKYGYQYRGGGNMHTTWKENYKKFADHIGDPRIMEGADYVAEKYPWLSAGFWWLDNNMNDLVDSLDGKDPDRDVAKVTVQVNRGDTGLAKRREYHQELRRVIAD